MEACPMKLGQANESKLLWKAKDYGLCGKVLDKLAKESPQDFKVLHNKAIAEFCAKGSENTEEILASLQCVKDSLERSFWSNAAEPGGTGTYLAAAETSVVSLNLAIVHYRRKEMDKVLKLLEPQFACIGPLDDVTAFRVCVLLLDVYILKEDFNKAKTVLGFLEKTHGNFFNPEDLQAASEHLGDKGKAPFLDSNAVGVHTGDSSSSNTDESEEINSDPHPLALSSMSKMGLTPLHIGPKNSDSRPESQKPGVADLKIQIHLYRAKLLLAMKNLKMVSREVKCILSAAPSNVPGLFLKAQVHLQRGNLKKAARILSKCVEGTTESSTIRVAALCNMGVIYHRMRKHNSACLCFSNALKQHAGLSTSSQGSEVLSLNSGSPNEEKQQLLYNAGLQHLLLKRYSLALDCFGEVVAAMSDKAFLWLRMAECCLGIFHDYSTDKANSVDSGNKTGGSIVSKVLHEAGSPQVVLLPEPVSTISIPNEATSALSDANSYLQNACYLLERQEGIKSSFTHNHGGEDPLEGANGHQDAPEFPEVLQYAICKRAYISLHLNQPELAYALLEPLIDQAWKVESIHVLVYCYAAEALCLTDRLAEAINLLSMFLEKVEEHEKESPFVSANGEKENVPVAQIGMGTHHNEVIQMSGVGARAALYVNLATVYASQGDLNEAQQYASKAIESNPSSVHATMILVYVELARGNKVTALSLLKKERNSQRQ